MIAPWHETATCIEGADAGPRKICGGPLVPFAAHDTPHTAPNTCHVKCAACGHDYIENNVRVLACIWWSAGAWEAKKSIEEGRG